MFRKTLLNILLMPLLIFLLISCGGGGGGTAVNYNSGPSSSGGTFLDSGTSVTYNSTTASNHQAYDPYENVTGSTQSSHQNPFDQINAYKAYGYGYSGDGVQIAILDSGYDTNHYTYQGKTVSTYGTLTADNSNHDAGDNHGNFVASVAAGYLDTSYSGTTASHGVAYDADIHLASNDQKGSETYYPDQWANSLDDASNAVVQNNSWGFTNRQYSSGTSYTSANLASYSTNDTGLTANASSIDNYVTALDSFQDHGVIVFAVSNTSSYSEPDIQVAMPEIYSNLNEAWINVVNVDITGSSGSETYTRKSAPCGSTAKYCVAADGHYISGALDYTSGSSWFHTGGSTGSSFAAPQVSGAVAILAEAFPSQTPAQWTDRLLASADNSMCTASGNVSFANGITHAYCSDYGHGVIDIYAALRPITSSKMQESILIGENTETASVHNLSKTSIKSNSIFGDSISRSFENKKGYFYDALYGAFEYDFSKHLQYDQEITENVLDNHFNEQNLQSIETVTSDQNLKTNYSFTTNANNEFLLDQGINYSISGNNKNLSASYNYPLDVSLGFINSSDIKKINNNIDTSIPYIDSEGNHYSTSSKIFDNGDSSMSLGYLQTDKSSLIEKNALALSFINKKLDTSFLIGHSNEKNGFLNNSFEGALSVEKNNPTNFIAFKKNKKTKMGELMFVSSLGTTEVKNNNNSLIRNIDDVFTSSFAINYSKPNILFNNSNLNFSILQPQRVESGSMTYDIPGLNDKDGSLNYTTYTSDLDPSGRQIDLSIKYSITNKIGIKYIIENKLINDHGHESRDNLDYQFAASMMYEF
tara:strand:+ start:2097 stop:4544 length:2448 start_codon:yes stop_codon:yes gene_type:complete